MIGSNSGRRALRKCARSSSGRCCAAYRNSSSSKSAKPSPAAKKSPAASRPFSLGRLAVGDGRRRLHPTVGGLETVGDPLQFRPHDGPCAIRGDASGACWRYAGSVKSA